MNQARIQENIQNIINNFNKESFIFDLLLAYGLPKAGITRLRKGDRNLSSVPGEISWKKKLFFKEAADNDLHLIITNIKSKIKHDQRFIIVTDYQTLLAIDTKTDDKLDIPLNELPTHFDFFLPWAGMEKVTHKNDNPADVKAAEKMARLFDIIKKDNPDDSPEFIHGLNVFLSRLLFCFFAEDTNIFRENQFVNALDAHTNADGSDLGQWFESFFLVLDTHKEKRSDLPEYLNAFHYVNGNLFNKRFTIPQFTRRSRQAIIDGGQLQWKDINPDIFGSMFQAVIGADQRGSLGQHYTSVPNIMKVIEPLFLNELYEEFNKAIAHNNPAKTNHDLSHLLHRISKIKIFDPACGSGNFLIIAYKELRRLEMKIFIELEEIEKSHITKLSNIHLNRFYGIEIDDFAHEVAMLALWLTEHQMNVEFKKQFGQTNPTLPLKDSGNIVQGNATRLNWDEVCPKSQEDEVFVLGNPPYRGFSQQSTDQKSDLNYILGSTTKLDYIACWFILGSKYIGAHPKTSLAFVSTNSITQGEQVALLWPFVLNENKTIFFAHKSFKWTNSAKSKAGVTVVIIGITSKSINSKIIFENSHEKKVDFINPYLSTSKIIGVQKRKEPISPFPKMVLGNMPNDFGGLQFSPQEKQEITNNFPETNRFFKRVVGSQEFIKDIERWCLWVKESDVDSLKTIPQIAKRLLFVKDQRANSKKKSYNIYAEKPHRFIEIRHQSGTSLIIPGTSSEKREYLPIGLLTGEIIINNLAFAIYNPPIELFGILSSRIHNNWLRAVGGSLETRIRYSSLLCYNTFPFPQISDRRKQEITQGVFRILEEREKHPDKTMAQLYDPDKMPDGLREAHRLNDLAVEQCYRSRPFQSDEERLEHLFKLYEQMT
ncbi:class I SAM-dependent DNA methyltransferase [Marinilabilia salmonicolor]|uniref:class I SAM-dependent DNA methyltransferase n=1 Tax=Marinilabilia salmonicolor TaxID=989 RepID=UPI00029A1F7B|nr:DNA methyltransferase [Marinilabilia salmonicolor]